MPHKDLEKRREAVKFSMRRARAKLRATRAITSLVSESPLVPIREDSQDKATKGLASLMVSQGLTPETILAKVKQRMESTQVKAILWEREIVDDNDAQLKATEIAMDLASRAGLLPSDRSINGSGNINLQIISFNAEKQEQAELVLDMQSDNA